MAQILVNSPSGEQKIENIGDTGAYYDQSKVIWDERYDGAMPPVTLGKMQRKGKKLEALPEYLTEHAARIYAKSVPMEVPIAPACEALALAGLYDAVDSYMATQPAVDRIWWARASTIHRKFPMVEAVRIELGMTHEQIDNLFIAAEQIRKQKAGEV